MEIRMTLLWWFVSVPERDNRGGPHNHSNDEAEAVAKRRAAANH